jgi:hypothetical protein
MAAVGTTAQRKQLLRVLLDYAASGRHQATTTALAAAFICSKTAEQETQWHIGKAERVLLAQPYYQWQLLEALSSSNRIVAAAAEDILARLWRGIAVQGAAIAAVPGYAATIQQAVEEVQSNGRLAAAAAELCWLASKSRLGSADLLLVHAHGLMAAATRDGLVEQGQQQQQQQQQGQLQQQDVCQIFGLAALCSSADDAAGQPLDMLAGQLLLAPQQLPPLLQIWLGGTLDGAELADNAAAAAEVMPQVVNLLQRLLHALRCSNAGEQPGNVWLAAAAADVLSKMHQAVLGPALDLLAGQLEQQQQQTIADNPSQQLQQHVPQTPTFG